MSVEDGTPLLIGIILLLVAVLSTLFLEDKNQET